MQLAFSGSIRSIPSLGQSGETWDSYTLFDMNFWQLIIFCEPRANRKFCNVFEKVNYMCCNTM